MGFLEKTVQVIDQLNERVGRFIAWAAIIMVLVQFTVVVMRYIFGIGSIMMQESVIYLHGILFMVGAGYTLLHDGHVRVDIFYREASPRNKAIIDLFGSVVLLLPVCVLFITSSFQYVLNTWHVFEGSRETSGIPGVFLLKSVIWIFAVLIALQGISIAAKSVLRLTGNLQDSTTSVQGNN